MNSCVLFSLCRSLRCLSLPPCSTRGQPRVRWDTGKRQRALHHQREEPSRWAQELIIRGSPTLYHWFLLACALHNLLLRSALVSNTMATRVCNLREPLALYITAYGMVLVCDDNSIATFPYSLPKMDPASTSSFDSPCTNINIIQSYIKIVVMRVFLFHCNCLDHGITFNDCY